MYKINPSAYGSVFVLPSEVADRHLRLAGKAQLKVLLWLFRHSGDEPDIKRISKDTGIPEDEIDDAALYWIEAGIIVNDDNEAVYSPEKPKSEKPMTEEVKATEKKVEYIPTKTVEFEKNEDEQSRVQERPPVIKPSITQISARLAESKDIAYLFNEAQTLFGRTLGYDGQSSLLLLHDYYGLSTEVILILCEYAKSIGRLNSMNYIMKTGMSWADEDIDTFDKASRKITSLEKTDKLWVEFRVRTGIENPRPTARQSEYFGVWIDKFHLNLDMICLAYEKTADKKGKIDFRYMNGILSSWHMSGYKTIEDVEESERQYASEIEKKRENTAKTKKPSSSSSNGKGSGTYSPPSYDLDLVMQQAMNIDPTKTKRGQ